MDTWFQSLCKQDALQVTPAGNNGDDRNSRRQRAIRALIRWIVNGTALAVVHSQLYQTTWSVAICIGITIGFFSALLQYRTPDLTKFYERDALANAQNARVPGTAKHKIELLRWSERATRWFIVEREYILYSETIRALFGLNVTGSLSLTHYITQRLCGAIISTISQGAWELTVLAWCKKRVETGTCSETEANNQRDWAFLAGSLVSVSSLAASLSPYPELGYCGFGVLVAGAIAFYFRGSK